MTDHFDAAANRKARDARKAAQLRQSYDRHVARFRATGLQDAATIARDMHQSMDDVLARDRGKDPVSNDISCARGCSHCCHGPVEIGPHEAALLVERVLETGGALDRTRLERQSRYTLDNWWQQPAAGRACVFLGGDGACTVYDVRPGACRKLLVVTEPAWCDSSAGQSARVIRWFSWETEMIASAALEIFGSALLPRALLNEMGARGS